MLRLSGHPLLRLFQLVGYPLVLLVLLTLTFTIAVAMTGSAFPSRADFGTLFGPAIWLSLASAALFSWHWFGIGAAGLRLRHPRDLLIGLAIIPALGIEIAMLPGVRIAGYPDLAGAAATAFLGIALPEELYFRGLLYSGLARVQKAPRLSLAAASVSSAVFAVFHLYDRPAEFIVPIFAAGLVLATLRAYTSSIWPAWIAHGLIDFALYGVVTAGTFAQGQTLGYVLMTSAAYLLTFVAATAISRRI